MNKHHRQTFEEAFQEMIDVFETTFMKDQIEELEMPIHDKEEDEKK